MPIASPIAVLRFPGLSSPGRVRALRGDARIVATHDVGEVTAVLREAERAARAGRWAVGYVAYEAAPAFGHALATRAGSAMPLAWFAIADDLADEPLATSRTPRDGEAPALAWDDADAHARDVAKVREAIAAGEVYQVNLAVRLRAPFDGDALDLAARLWDAQGDGVFGAYLDLGAHRIACASPELFLRREGATITTRPMKGTAPRGRYPDEDARLARELAASSKERAENVMIVDLLRNDLGRVARTGEVRVTRLFEVERWRSVWQMTSTIEAELRDGVDLADLFAAAFPCGSVTGAPKVTAMRAIAALERAPREVYCGALGVIAPGGDATFAVPIRTAWHDVARGELVYPVGSGVTWDSTASGERDELVAKARVVAASGPRRAPRALLETMRVEGATALRAEAHLARLAASAAHLGLRVDVAAARALLAAIASEAAPRRARLVAPDGEAPSLELAPLDATTAPLRVALAAAPIDPRDPRWFHKLADRSAYDDALAARPGFDDALLWNDRGEATELTRGNLVVELDGARVTPPLDAGLLPGVLRAELLARGDVEERPVRLADLARARRAFRVSALRGEIEIALPIADLG